MAFDAHANFATSLVATAPSPASSGTSLGVTAGEGSRFPATSFNATVGPANTLLTPANAEVVRVTAISTDTFTITRTQEGSNARAILVGDQIFNSTTKKTFTDLEVADAIAATASLRSLGANATQAAPGDQTEFAFSSWKTIKERTGFLGAAAAGGTYLIGFASTAASVTSGSGSAMCGFRLDPADFPGGTRTVKIRMRGMLFTNAVAPTVSYTFNLNPIATWGGASGATPSIASISAATLSCPIITTPGATSQTDREATAVTFPSAAWYVMTLTSSGSAAAGAVVAAVCELQVQQV